MTTFLLCVCIFLMFLYSFHLKDVYYGYGKAVAFQEEGHTLTETETGSLEIKSPEGSSTSYYVGFLAYHVVYLLRKNGFTVNKETEV